MDKYLVIVRGIPGSGKSTFAQLIAKAGNYTCVAADDFFYDKEGNYNFNFKQLGLAHKFCFDIVEKALQKFEEIVIVHNTFVKEREIETYKKLAEKYNYKFISSIVENRHGNNSVHGVPDETVERFKENFSVKL